MKKNNSMLWRSAAICLLLAASCSDAPSPAPGPADTTNHTAMYQFLQASICPVGSVIAYCGDPATLPANWCIADGSKVDDPESLFFSGKNLPDLRDRFVMGASKETKALSTGGQAWLHGHTHGLPGKSGTLSVDFSDVVQRRVNLNQGTGGNFFVLASADRGTLSRRTASAPSSQSTTAADGKADNRPPFVALWYIVRIK
jgi:hypothetical protein